MMAQGNQWAWLTDYSIDIPMGGPLEVRFSGIALGTPEVLNAMQGWLGQPWAFSQLPLRQEEWICLYCGAVQDIARVKCENCGAPRSWLL